MITESITQKKPVSLKVRPQPARSHYVKVTGFLAPKVISKDRRPEHFQVICGKGKSKQGLIFAEIIESYFADQIVTTDGNKTYIDAKKLNPVGRLGGNDFVSLGEVMTIERPISK